MCRSRGAHVACTRTYSGHCARKKIQPCMCTYGRGLERLLVHTYGKGSCTWLGRNGETASSSGSWGSNGLLRVHREATERVGANRLGRNGMRGRVHREGLDGTGDGNEAWHTAKQRKRTSYGRIGGPVDREECGVPQNGGNGPPTVETRVLLIGRAVAYRQMEEMDLLHSERGPVDREGCGVPQNGGNRPPTVETGVMLIGRGVAYR